MKLSLSILLGFILFTQLHAEIKKTVIPVGKCGRMCFYWWPVLPKVEGWHQDIKGSYEFAANTQAPDKFTFANSETVIYAKALYKPRIPKISNIYELIDDDRSRFEKDAELTINKINSTITADGQKLLTYSFYPKGKGNWEHVSYGEEGDFFLVFTISSRTKSGLEKNLPVYNEFIEKYKKVP